METINDLGIYIYSFVGLVFICLSIFILTFSKINNGLRLGVSAIFLITGFHFFNLAGNILTNYSNGFIKLSLFIAGLLTILANVLVYIIYKLNKENIEHQKKKK